MFSSLEYTDCFADRFRFWVFDRVRSRRFEKEAWHLWWSAVFCHYQFSDPMADTSCSICTLYCSYIYSWRGNSHNDPPMASTENRSVGGTEIKNRLFITAGTKYHDTKYNYTIFQHFQIHFIFSSFLLPGNSRNRCRATDTIPGFPDGCAIPDFSAKKMAERVWIFTPHCPA